ncbi:Hypothetical predicted protein [Mytilus galloprovincialis]|uniref:Uncharacterized protein n=1 Tax=Mytilus galloprovincialis TaxID=29158 RepID=A0A8B6BKU7_MYTGA|nr:Hypothetical predicted protein [Mytilus galloprovincialis]
MEVGLEKVNIRSSKKNKKRSRKLLYAIKFIHDLYLEIGKWTKRKLRHVSRQQLSTRTKSWYEHGYCFHEKSKYRRTKPATLIVKQRESAGVFTLIILELYIVMRNLRRG